MNKTRLLIFGAMVLILIGIVLTIFISSTSNKPVSYLNIEATSTQDQASIVTMPTNSNAPTVPATSTLSIINYHYTIGLPNSLMVVDFKGRRTGKDPVTGVFYHEIAGSSYAEVGSATSSTKGTAELFFSEPPFAQYTVYVLGGETGQYSLSASAYSPALQTQQFSGGIKLGSMISFVPNYDTTNPAAFTLSLKAHLSSTASITSAPAQNLP